MLVDPNTGLPMAVPTSPDANTITGGAVINQANQMGYMQGTALEMAANLPSVKATTLWNMHRGSNTIIGGGWSNSVDPRGTLANNRPRSIGRMASIQNVDSTIGAGKHYSPMQVLAKGGNTVGNWLLNNEAIGGSTRVKNWMREINAVNNAPTYSPKRPIISGPMSGGATSERMKFFSSGTGARLNAASKLAKGASSADLIGNLAKLDPHLTSNFQRISGHINTLNRSQAAHLTAMSGNGLISSQLSGYMTSTRIGMTETVRQTATEASRATYLSGAGKAASHLGGGNLSVNAAGKLIFREAGEEAVEKVGMKAAAAGIKFAMNTPGGKAVAAKATAKVGLALGARATMFTNPYTAAVGTAIMMYDITKMGMSMVTGAIDTAKDAAISFKGSIDKPVMGMGYRDNTVAATSRARGVMAIQNSRLNARSVFGNEGALMAAHFG